MSDPLVVAADRRPEAVAVDDATVTWTWRGLLAQARDVAAKVAAPSPAAIDRVGMLMHDSAIAIAVIHGVRLAGATLVPLHRRLTLAELIPLVRRSRMGMLLHDAAHESLAMDLAAATPGLIPHQAPHGHATLWGEPSPPDHGPGGAIVWTSGTTGQPKGVVLTTDALFASAAAWNEFLHARPTDHWLATLPLSHVAGLGVVLRAAGVGARVTVHERFEAARVREVLAGGGITHVSLVPTQLARLLEAGVVAAPGLRALLLGGAPIPAALVERATRQGLPIVTTYGLTEAASGVTALSSSQTPHHPASAGLPLPGARLRIMIGQTMADVGEPGTIEVAGPALFSGYEGDPATTARSLVDGWLHTGDMGSIDAQGRLSVLDRQDALVISGGENVSPAEIEAVLGTHPLVADVAVTGRPDPTWGAVPVAAVVPRGAPGDPRRPAEVASVLLEWCRARLAGYKVPAGVAVLSAIPRTASGKTLRHDLARAIAGAPTHQWLTRPDGARVHVVRQGDGPVVVLSHATLSDSDELGSLSAALSRRMLVVAIDRRSAGASVMPPDDRPAPVDVALHVADLRAAISSQVGDVPVLLTGHSYGGCVALESAARLDRLATGVWAFEPPYLPLLAGQPDPAALGDRITGIAVHDGLPAAALAFLETVNGPDVGRRLPAGVRTRIEREGRSAVADAALAGMDPAGLERIRVPVAVGLGGRSRGPYAAVAAELAERLHDVQVDRFDQLGHGGPITRPDAIADHILAFAERIGHLPRTQPDPGGPS